MRRGMRYLPKYCAFLRRSVWAIAVRQPDGGWKIANCLDKEEGCFHLGCAFTTDMGEWPYQDAPATGAHDLPR